MPRQHPQGFRRSLPRGRPGIQNNINSESVVTVPFNAYFQVLIGTTPSLIPITNLAAGFLFSSRLSDIASSFALTRCMSLTVQFMDQSPAGSVSMAAYQPGTTFVTPTTITQVGESPGASVWMPGMTVPARLSLGRRDLMGPSPQKWWPTQITGTPTEQDIQGSLILVAGANSTTLNVVVQGVYQFTAPSNAGLFQPGPSRPLVEDTETKSESWDVPEVKEDQSTSARLANQGPRIIPSYQPMQRQVSKRLSYRPP